MHALSPSTFVRGIAAALALAAAVAALPGCVPLIVGGAVVGSGLVVTDRRTTGIQIEDESIELKAASRARAAFNDLSTIRRATGGFASK